MPHAEERAKRQQDAAGDWRDDKSKYKKENDGE